MTKKRMGRKPTGVFEGRFLLVKGDEEIMEGTIEEIAAARNRKVETIKYYLSPSYKKRVANYLDPDSCLCLIPLDYDLPD